MPVQPLIDDPQVRELAEKQIIAGAFADEAVTTRGGIKNLPQALQRPTLPALKIPQEYEGVLLVQSKTKAGVQELPHKKIRLGKAKSTIICSKGSGAKTRRAEIALPIFFTANPSQVTSQPATIINKSLLQKIFQKQNHK